MELINEINKDAGIYYEIVQIADLKNLIFQYKLIAGVDNTVEIQFWGTVYTNADGNTDDDWVNITEFLTELNKISVENETLHDMTLLDTNCTFAKIRIKYIIVTSSPNNTIKIGWNSDK